MSEPIERDSATTQSRGTTMEDLWPAYGITIRCEDLVLTPITDDDLPGLVDLVLDGIHAADFMPFDVPWTHSPPEELPRRFAQHHWGLRASCTPERLDLEFAVRRADVLVGVQGFHAQDFAVTRTAETGSWLAQRYHRQGIGTRMRTMICTFLFDELQATEVTSAAFADNQPSLGVSRKVGYRPNGTIRKARLGASVVNQRLRLDPGDLVRGAPVVVTGVERLRAFLGVG